MRQLPWLLLATLFLPAAASAATEVSGPRLEVHGDGAVERLPLTLTDVDVSIAGVIADVSVRQVFENRGDVPIEAIYVFPGSPRSAVHALTMTVGNRVIEADIRAKEKAREEYEEARESGRTASLLEQLDPSVFSMRVANILPGDRIEVRLRYTELLVPTDGVYEFVFPTTMDSSFDDGSQRHHVATSVAPEVTAYSFAVAAQVQAALPLQSVDSPSHAVDVARGDAWSAQVTLAEEALADAGTRDFRLRYRLAGDEIESGLLLYPEGDGGYFLLMAEPPARVRPEWVAPREYVFVLDVSGSMIGAPLETARHLMGELIASLRPTDLFNVVLFAGGSNVLFEEGSRPAGDGTLDAAWKLVENATAGGSTELTPALERVYAMPVPPSMSRSIVIVTDGVINAAGDTYRLIRSHLRTTNVFAFGIGMGMDEDTIERLARAGAGEPFMVADPGAGPGVASKLREYVESPLLTHIALLPDGLATHDLEPEQPPSLLASRPVTVVGRYRGNPSGAITIEGLVGGEPHTQRIAVDRRMMSAEFEALRRLWARTRIQRLLDEQFTGGYYRDQAPEHEAEITRLGLEYSLLTPYTSFVAIDREVRTTEIAVPVEQPAIAEGVPMVAQEPLPAAAPTAAWVGGSGNAMAALVQGGLLIGVEAGSVLPAVSMRRRVIGIEFELRGDVWTDMRHAADRPLLRIAPNSPALARLLQLRPELAALLALGERVLVVLGSHAVLITPDGFSSYPDAVLERAARG